MDQYFQQPEYGGTSIEKCISNYPDENEGNNCSSGGFECNICLDPVHDPVVTLCGHLYCWPCIYKWIHFKTSNSEVEEEEEEKEKMKPQCPVCKTNISERKLIPLYAKGQTCSKPSSSSSNDKIIIPRRPSSPPSSSSCVSPNCQQQQFHHHQTLLQPAAALAGRMVYERIFGNLYNGEYSYRLAGSSSPRMRRHLVETDRSLGRLCFFLFCCLMFCLLLF
ncbi:E3 ubiquitin-protein ligase RMA1H1-like [Impatiens glandulifera]|uniref:E3 ubiquitin-protein ligase RMA1H1-like n=1 Tax=Impatiens glandulifera TaxID=253017 RepID=UPI001FB1655A|nr:E3 ubiquitin-protein ligase RMA1H1-like [Impatiens glandulifera]XP_047337214.1 E3 ubiquitin-protein ligase RMA1H1-like [Impatiens glandulifera]